MKIGALAAAAGGMTVDAVRHYERQGLLPAPSRTDGNYRDYGPEHLRRLQFIRSCRALDLSFEEIRLLLRHLDGPQADCGEVHAVLDAHIAHVAARIRELRSLEKDLKALRARAAGPEGAGCGVLAGLEAAGAGVQRRGVHS